MRTVILDTTVLFSGTITAHRDFASSKAWLDQAEEDDELYVSTHTLAEFYSNLTKGFVRPKVSPAVASRVVRSQTRLMTRISLNIRDYHETIDRAGELGLESGQIYDALTAQAGMKRGVDFLCTYNVRHFRRIWPEDRIIVP